MSLEPHIQQNLLPCLRLNPDYQICKKSGVVYFRKAFSESSSYGKDYYVSDYKKQYGCTYAEDEMNLRQTAKHRLKTLQFFLHSKDSLSRPPQTTIGNTLLEIGSALGFFLEEARKKKFHVQGIEISQYAAKYAQEKGKLKIHQGSFLEYPLKENSFDVICAFYVIEHIPEQKSAFRKISQSLKENGFFYFAFPSIYGPLFHLHLREWIRSHPADHFADYSPHSLKKIFPLYGMRLIKTWPASFHPERMIPAYLWKTRPLSFFYRFFSKFLCYGDTIEGIAVKL